MAGTVQPVIVSGGGNKVIPIVAGIATLALAYFGKKEYDKWKLQQDKAQGLKLDQASTVKPAAGKKLFDLNGKPISSANLGMIATDIRDALSFPTDDARAVRAFKNTPFGYVPALEKLYLEKYKGNLRDRMASNLEDEYWIQIKYWFK